MSNVDPATLLLQRLQDTQGPWGRRVADLLITHAFNIPVAALVEADDMRALITDALTEASVGIVTSTHVKPAWHRQLARARKDRDTVGDTLPATAVTAIDEILRRGVGPRFQWLQGAVEPKLLAQLIAPIVQQVLLGFVQKLPGVIGGGGGTGSTVAGGLIGALGRGVQQRASALADVGKAVMGGIGVDVEKKLQNAAKDFSQSALSIIREATLTRLQSEDGRALVQAISTQVFAKVRATPIHVIQDDVNHLPIDEFIDLVPSIVAHNRGREVIERVIREEVDAALQVLGTQTIGDLVRAHGLEGSIRDIAGRVVPAQLAAFFADDAAIALVRELLTPAP